MSHVVQTAGVRRLAIGRRIACLGLALPVILWSVGCSNAGQGAVSGAGVGALSGLVIGSFSGNAGTGAAIGAVVGGAGGAVIGDQNKRRDEATRANTRASTPAPAPLPAPAPALAPAPAPAPLTRSDRDRMALANLARWWNVSGWELVDGQRQFVTGTSVGAVENNYFIRMEMRISPDGRPEIVSTGNIVFGAEPGRGLTMTSRFNTSPSSMSYAGTVSADGRTFMLEETAFSGGGGGRRIVIQFLNDNEFVADVTNVSGRGTEAQASLRFSGAR